MHISSNSRDYYCVYPNTYADTLDLLKRPKNGESIRRASVHREINIVHSFTYYMYMIYKYIYIIHILHI